MKYQLLLLILLTFSLSANENTVEYKDFYHLNYDHISIPYDSVKIYGLEDKKSLIKKRIDIYQAFPNKGEPFIIIDESGITIDGKKSSYSLLDHCLTLNNCSKKFLDLDFIEISEGAVLLNIEGYVNGNAYVINKNKKIFFNINQENFNKVIATWREYVFPNGKTTKLEELVDIKELKATLTNIEECVSNKSTLCLVKYFDKNYTVELIEKEVLKRAVLDDKKLCFEFQKINNENDGERVFSDELLKSANIKSDLFWNSFKRALSFNIKSSLITLQYYGFEQKKSVLIKNRIPKNIACENDEDLEFKLEKKNDKWMITSFKTYSFIL